MDWIGWLVAASVAVGLGTLLWLARAESARLRAQLDQTRRAHAQELGEVKASATRQLRAEKTEARHAVQGIAADLLPVADGMDRAIAQGSGGAEIWRKGVELVRASLEAALARHGVRPVEVEPGQAFAPKTQECISELPFQDEDAPLTIAAVQRRGWMLHDRLLRPAEVVLQRVSETPLPASLDAENAAGEVGEASAVAPVEETAADKVAGPNAVAELDERGSPVAMSPAQARLPVEETAEEEAAQVVEAT
jgi:molecular chaperone GrpE